MMFSDLYILSLVLKVNSLWSMKWWVQCSLKCNYSEEIETHFTHSGTRLKRKLTGSTLVGVNIEEVPLNERLR